MKRIQFNDRGIAAVLSISIPLSLLLLSFEFIQQYKRSANKAWLNPIPAESRDIEHTRAEKISVPTRYLKGGLFVGELRVKALGSGYPISYEAAQCPFSGAKQPPLNTNDWDEDGILDDWELRYGFDRYASGDAALDPDGDGFSNVEEFNAGTDPVSGSSHPPYALKYRFVRMIETPFPLIFQGVCELSDGHVVFQLNAVSDGKTHFIGINESLEGIVPQRFIKKKNSENYALLVKRRDLEILLPRGKKVIDPESRVEVINVLDHTTEIATMGALLSLRNDVYTVVGVSADGINLRQHGTDKVFRIVGSAKGGVGCSPEDLKNRVN